MTEICEKPPKMAVYLVHPGGIEPSSQESESCILSAEIRVLISARRDGQSDF